MTVTEIVQLVDAQTEKRASKQLSLTTLLNNRLQLLCQSKLFPWLIRTAEFQITAADNGESLDLSTLSRTGLPVSDIREMHSLALNVNGSTTTTFLPRVFDQVQQRALLYESATGVPTRWFPDPDNPSALCLRPRPAATYNVLLDYISNPEISGDTIPVLPECLHPALAAGLEMDVFRFLYGPDSQKFLAAKANYDDIVAKAV